MNIIACYQNQFSPQNVGLQTIFLIILFVVYFVGYVSSNVILSFLKYVFGAIYMDRMWLVC